MKSTSGTKILDRLEIELQSHRDDLHRIYIDVYDNSLSRKWLSALNDLLTRKYHLEKNYCFMGFTKSERNGPYLLDQINQSILAVNQANLGYQIDDHFSMENTISDEPIPERQQSFGVSGRNIIQHRLNNLHRYFEDLQGVSGQMSPYYLQADSATKWHIRQLNLLCHEFENWALSYRKEIEAPEWQRPSQLMCWLQAPRFVLDEEDFGLFGIDTLSRELGGVFVGVNKAVGKHHWEVFQDEGRDSRVNELTTSTMRGQTEAAGDFDIEWANDPTEFYWQKTKLQEFREWLKVNGFDPDDAALTIGHPQVGRVDLLASFDSTDYRDIWSILEKHLDVYSIRSSSAQATYEYHWSDADYMYQQIAIIGA